VIGSAGPVFRGLDLRGQLTENPRGHFRGIRTPLVSSGGVARPPASLATSPGNHKRRGAIANAAKKKMPIESIKRVTGQRSNSVVLEYVAAATLDGDPPLLEIGRRESKSARGLSDIVDDEDPDYVPVRDGSNYVVYGETGDGRLLVIALEPISPGYFRPFAARDM